MDRRLVTAIGMLAAGFVADAAFAQEGASPADGAPTARDSSSAAGSNKASSDAAAKGTKSDKAVRRDPAGVKGISPYMETIANGDKAFLARDYDGAVSAYTEAIKLDPKKALGHYRQGLAHVEKGDLKKAEDAFMAGLRLAFKSDPVRMELLFALSRLRERQRQLRVAAAVWKEYSKLFTELEEAAKEKHQKELKAAKGKKVKAPEKVVGFPKTSEERQAKIAAYLEVQKAATAVKEQAAKKLKEAEEKGKSK